MKEEDRVRTETRRAREEEITATAGTDATEETAVTAETAEDVRREAAETSGSADRAHARADSAATEGRIPAAMTERA